MSLEFLISKIQKNKFLLIGRAGIDIYPDPPGTKTENAKNFVTHLGGSSANMGVELTKLGWQIFYFTMDNHLKILFQTECEKLGDSFKLIELANKKED